MILSIQKLRVQLLGFIRHAAFVNLTTEIRSIDMRLVVEGVCRFSLYKNVYTIVYTTIESTLFACLFLEDFSCRRRTAATISCRTSTEISNFLRGIRNGESSQMTLKRHHDPRGICSDATTLSVATQKNAPYAHSYDIPHSSWKNDPSLSLSLSPTLPRHKSFRSLVSFIVSAFSNMMMQRTFAFAVFLATSVSGFVPFRPMASSSNALFSVGIASVPITTNTWEVRKAVDGDITAVIDLLEQKCAFDRSLHGREPSKLKSAPGETLRSLYPEVPNGRILFVGPEAQDPIGFALYALRYYGLDSPPSLWLEDIFVDPTKRSGGAGKAMMDELANVADENFCSHLAWHCDHRNERGLGFYKNLGATVTDESGELYKMKWVPACLS